MSKTTRPTQAAVTKYAKAVKAAGLEPREVRIEPDGTVRVLIGTGATEALSALEAWKASRGARK